jgi:adenylate kinase family enzyme
MLIVPTDRLVVIGNSGSGKSTLAEGISVAARLPVYDLDLIHWQDDGRKREEAASKGLVSELASTDAWIIEGVYGWLAQVALPRATALIWTDIPWAECQDGLTKRGLRRGMTDDDQKSLIAWARDYWSRATSSSFVGHESIFNALEGKKLRLTTRQAASTVLTRIP